MLLKGSQVLENIDEGNLSRELEIAKFRNYGRENFSDLIKYHLSFEEYIDNTTKFFSIQLPDVISDYFIRIDLAPNYILSDAPIFEKLKELILKKGGEYNFVANFREIKNYYYKWLVQKTEKEKYFFANSIVSTIERNYNFQSFYSLLIYGIIATYDKTVYNPKRAVEVFNRAIEMIDNCNLKEDFANELKYLIKLYKGFLYLKEYEYSLALSTFQDATINKNHGITAYFYSSLSAMYLDNFDQAFDNLKEIIEFDKARFKYAISFNHLKLFTFFYENAVFYNVFTENGFAPLLPDIDFIIRSLHSNETNSMQHTYEKLINLDNLRIKEFYNEAVYTEIKFLKNALDHYKQKKAGLIRIVEQIFRDKLITVIEYIRNLIESHYFDQIKEDIVVFDRQIEQNQRQLTRIKHELDDARKKIKMNIDEAAKYLEESITEKSRMLEEKIKYLDKNPKYNPSQVLYSSLLFTVFVSIIIFIVVGFITSMVGYGEEAASVQLAARVGLKWSGVTFGFGVFISVFTSFSSFWEKSAEKKELINKLNIVKQLEEEERQLIHEDSEHKALIYEQKFKERIKAQEKIIENFIQEREQNYKTKYNEAKKEIEAYLTPLNELLESLHANG